MRLNDVPISVSLATVVFKPSAKGTQMIFTEQAVFLDGYDDPDGRDRKRGTDAHFERLDAFLKKVPAHS
jgi:hypothetical protein